MRKIPGDLFVLAIAVAAGVGLFLLHLYHSAHAVPAHPPVTAQTAHPIRKP
jgi:hypothetical protein